MDFTLTDEQQLLVDTASTLFTNECPSALVRACIEDPSASDELWRRHLSGWVELAAGDVVDLAFFVTEAGRATVPGVFVPSVLAALVLDPVGHPEAAAVVSGSTSATLAVAGDAGEWLANGDATKVHVPEADRVDRIVVVGGTPGAPTVAVIGPADVELRLIEQMDLLRRQFEVTTSVVGDAVDPAALERGMQRCLVALSAELIGVARWALDTAVEYSKERVQFGRPIGSFQGLQWMMVDAALDLERASAAVSYAAMCVDAGDPDRHRAVHGAKAEAGMAARHAVRTGTQVLGGIGYTWEHDMHLHLRRAFAGDAMFGQSSWHHDRLAGLLFD